jgi:hypothetical protein
MDKHRGSVADLVQKELVLTGSLTFGWTQSQTTYRVYHPSMNISPDESYQ